MATAEDYGSFESGGMYANDPDWPPVRRVQQAPPPPPQKMDSLLQHHQGRQGLDRQRSMRRSITIPRSMHTAMRNGRLNSVEDLRALDVEHSSLPKSWHDMTHDLEGIRQFQVSGGILLWIFMTVTTVAALITIFVGGDRVLVFWLSIAAIIPLGIQLGDISEVLSAWVGPVAGGLINATFGNATELMILVSAVSHGLVAIEQAVLLGGILMNMLLALGVSFIAGGMTLDRAQWYDVRAARTDIGVLLVTAMGVLLPTALATLRSSAAVTPAAALQWTLSDSRETAFVLLAMYAGYVFFRLKPVNAHSTAEAAAAAASAKPAPRPVRGFRTTDQNASDTGRGDAETGGAGAGAAETSGRGGGGGGGVRFAADEDSPLLVPGMGRVDFGAGGGGDAAIEAAIAAAGERDREREQRGHNPAKAGSNNLRRVGGFPTPEKTDSSEMDLDTPIISAVSCLLLLVFYAALVATFANALITSVFPVALRMRVPVDAIALCLIPVVGGTASLVTSVIAATHDHLDLSLAVALGSAVQIGMLLIPLAVFFGWGVGVPMSLDFGGPYALALFVAAVTLMALLMDGEAHWQKGFILCGVYCVVILGLVNCGFVGESAAAEGRPAGGVTGAAAPAAAGAAGAATAAA